jgi:hypothetical protein
LLPLALLLSADFFDFCSVIFNMLDFSGESKKNKRFFIFFVKKEPFLSAPKGMGFPGLKFIMKTTRRTLRKELELAQAKEAEEKQAEEIKELTELMKEKGVTVEYLKSLMQ